MDREQIIKMARDAGAGECFLGMIGSPDLGAIRIEWLERFAAAIRSATKDEDAKICEGAIDPEWPNDDMSVQAQDLASSIRASK